eukprot:g73151.t1
MDGWMIKDLNSWLAVVALVASVSSFGIMIQQTCLSLPAARRTESPGRAKQLATQLETLQRELVEQVGRALPPGRTR